MEESLLDHTIAYRLSSSGDILGKINTNGEITSASASKLEDFAAVGLSNRIPDLKLILTQNRLNNM